MHIDISDEQVLDNAGIRLTAVRLLIWRKVRHGFTDAFSLADLEAALPTVDRSTLFRTLTLLTEAHLLHEREDFFFDRSSRDSSITSLSSNTSFVDF